MALRRRVRTQTAIIRARLEKEIALEKRYRHLLENAAFPVIIFHRDSLTILYVNQRAAIRLYGSAPERSYSLASECCDNAESLKVLLRDLLRLGQVTEFEIRMRTIVGERFWALICANPIEFDGQPAIILSFSDITERKQIVEALRESESRFRTMFHEAPLGMALINSITGQIIEVNRHFAEIVGKAPAEMKTIDWMSITHPDDVRKDLDQIARLNAGEISGFQMNKRYLRPDQSVVWISMTIAPLKEPDPRDKRHLCMIEDITERRQLEKRLRHSQKMEGIGHLAGGVAHEFNNILAAMMMSLNLVQMNSMSAEVRDLIHNMEALSQRAADLIKQLLAFSRQSVLQLQPLDLKAVISGQCEMIVQLLGEGITLEFSRANGSAWVNADEAMLEQVLLNLCLNAREAMKSGGQLRLGLADAEVGAEQGMAHDDAAPGRYVCLSVADTGCGMNEEIMKRLFEPFFTTKDVGQGPGLGLATVRGIVQQHHGWVEVESTAGKGSTFQVYLPALAQTITPPPVALIEAIVDDRATILLVEDEPALRKATRAFLVYTGYVVWEAANGEEALALWGEHQVEIDLVYTDMVMPGPLTGLQLAERFLADKPGVKVIITSGYYSDLVDLKKVAESSIVYLPKPCQPATLGSVIQECLHPA
jgi:two-component system, cell cycle sensor histidine kinase and response regulator CckA